MGRTTRVSIAFFLAALAFGFAQKEVSIGTPRPESPKTVILRLIREPGASFSFNKLLDYQVVLERDSRQYLSTPLKAADADLSCSFSDVPPGSYRLKMDIFRLNTSVRIASKPVSKISLEMHIGSVITINELLPEE